MCKQRAFSGKRFSEELDGALLRSRNLDLRELDFAALIVGDGLSAPPVICSSIGALFPIAL